MDETPTLFYPRCRACFSVAFDGYDDDELGGKNSPLTGWVIPTEARIHRNGYEQADSWECTFDYLDFPFDPQQVRAGAIELYIFDAGGVFSDSDVVSRQYTLSPGSIRGADAMSLANRDVRGEKSAFVGKDKPQICGQFDDHNVEFSEGGRWVTLRGQDYTDLLIRKQWPPAKGNRARRIPTGDRIDVWAKKILTEVDPAGTLSVVVKDIGDLPTVGKGEVAGHRRGIPIQQGTTYWDVFIKVAERCGVICYIDGLDLVITRPKSLDDVRSPDVIQMAWGKNIQHLSMTRHFGKERVPRVVLKAWDDKNGQMVVIEEPEGSAKKKEAVLSKHPSKKTKDVQKIKAVTAKVSARPNKPKTKNISLTDEYVIKTVYGVTNPEILRQMARNYRRLVGRGERRIIVKTRDLCDLAGNQILNLVSGDAVNVSWKDFNMEAMQSPGLTTERRAAMIESRGYQPSVAMMIAKNYERLLGNQPPLRVRECSIDYSADKGVDIEMELLDYVVTEIEREKASGNEPPARKVDAKLEALMGKASAPFSPRSAGL